MIIKYLKKVIFIFIFCIIALVINTVDIEAYCDDKIYSDFSIDESYDTNSIVIIPFDLEENFSCNDFAEVNCTKIEELTGNIEHKTVNFKRIYCLKVDNTKGKKGIYKIIKKLEKRSDLFYVGPNYKTYINSSNSNTEEENGWWKSKIALNEINSSSLGTNLVKIGVIDTGVDKDHPALVGKVNTSLSKTFIDETSTTPFQDDVGHGTQIAGIICSNNSNGVISGVNSNVEIISLKIANQNNYWFSSNAIKAVSYAIEKNIPILNYSGNVRNETTNEGNYNDPAFEQILKNYEGLFVCSAGNSGININENNYYPATYDIDNIIVVGASNTTDGIWTTTYQSSNYGSNKVDIFAPGENILTSFPIDICNLYCTSSMSSHHSTGYHYSSGTSLATPIVTAVAAMILSKYPNMESTEIKATIILNATTKEQLNGKCIANGILNANSSLNNPHYHDYEYVLDDSINHYKVCDCNFIELLEEHEYVGNTCSLCNFVSLHTHNYNFRYYDRSSHILTCTCGSVSGEIRPHCVDYSDVNDGDHKATCLECNTILDLNFDFAIIRSLYVNVKKSENGSYQLPSGIIVLVEDDIDLYMNGELIFDYNEDLVK